MSQSGTELSGNEIGIRLRNLRQARGRSLREVARISGVSVNALSQIERGQSSPSVSTLYRLADALELPITSIFREETQRQDVVFLPASQRIKVPFPFGTWEGLGGELFAGRVQPFMLSLEAGANSGSGEIVHTGHEFVICLAGYLEYTVEERKFSLNPGDSLLFAARLRHSWCNSGINLAQVIFVLSGFDEYESPAGFHIHNK